MRDRLVALAWPLRRASGAPAAARSPPGVTPEMRAAWPSVSGRCARASAALRRQAAHLAVIEVRGQRERSPVLAGARPRRAGARCSPRTCLRSRPARRPRHRRRRAPAPGSVISARVRHAGRRSKSAANTRARAAGRARALRFGREHDARVDPGRSQALRLARDGFALARERLPARVVDDAQLAADLGQAQVGIVLAQLQAVLGAAGEHAVRLGHAARHQVVDQHAEVGLVAARAPGLLARARAARR